jgi:hypothetical protein
MTEFLRVLSDFVSFTGVPVFDEPGNAPWKRGC